MPTFSACLVVLVGTATVAVYPPAPAGAVTTAPTWTAQTPSTPPIQYGAEAYDQATGTIVLFGSTSSFGTGPGQTWTWNGTAWSQLAPPTSPSVRTDASMAYDQTTGNLVLFGGESGGGTVLSDTWSWDGTNWTELTPATSPPARHGASMDYDPATGTIVLFGGQSVYGGATGFLNDTWSWDGTTWTQLSPVTVPAARHGASMAYDPGTGDMVLFGGLQLIPGSTTTVWSDGSTWTWDGSNWQEAYVVPYGPLQGLYDTAMAYDPATGTMVLFGGLANVPGATLPVAQQNTWTWDGTTWTQVHPAASPPGGDGGTMDYDSLTGTLVYVQSSYGINGVTSSTWAYGAPPSVTGISPSTGLGGSTVVISGSDLLGATSVEFGTTPATITADTATSITATVPTGAGQVHVVVTTDAGPSTASSSDLFVYGMAPAFTSAASTTFTEDTAGTFTPTASGSPAPTVSESGNLPSGVTFDGTVLSGTPLTGSAGTYPVTFTATNGIGSPATQSFTLVVRGFSVATESLPDATPGALYGPLTLQAVGAGTSASPYVTTLKWKKVSLPKGLKLSRDGVLSGTLNAKLAPGSSSISVQVTETVTTFNGKKKVKTKTTVQATIPLNIS